jgi:hypothetical protein
MYLNFYQKSFIKKIRNLFIDTRNIFFINCFDRLLGWRLTSSVVGPVNKIKIEGKWEEAVFTFCKTK